VCVCGRKLARGGSTKRKGIDEEPTDFNLGITRSRKCKQGEGRDGEKANKGGGPRGSNVRYKPEKRYIFPARHLSLAEGGKKNRRCVTQEALKSRKSETTVEADLG